LTSIFCGARRDELLDYVYEHWGEEHVAGARRGPRVAMIASFITMHARLAVREVAKVFWACHRVKWTASRKRLPHRPVREILQAIRALPECRDLPIDDEPWKNNPASSITPRRRATASWNSSLWNGDFRSATNAADAAGARHKRALSSRSTI